MKNFNWKAALTTMVIVVVGVLVATWLIKQDEKRKASAKVNGGGKVINMGGTTATAPAATGTGVV